MQNSIVGDATLQELERKAARWKHKSRNHLIENYMFAQFTEVGRWTSIETQKDISWMSSPASRRSTFHRLLGRDECWAFDGLPFASAPVARKYIFSWCAYVFDLLKYWFPLVNVFAMQVLYISLLNSAFVVPDRIQSPGTTRRMEKTTSLRNFPV